MINIYFFLKKKGQFYDDGESTFYIKPEFISWKTPNSFIINVNGKRFLIELNLQLINNKLFVILTKNEL